MCVLCSRLPLCEVVVTFAAFVTAGSSEKKKDKNKYSRFKIPGCQTTRLVVLVLTK